MSNLSGPAGLVTSGFSQYSAIASSLTSQASGYAADLADLTVGSVDFNAQFTAPPGTLAGFSRPEQPEAPDLRFQIELPDPINIDVPELPDFGQAPEYDNDPPVLDFSGEPGRFEGETPPGAPELDEVEVPDAPVLTLPDAPQLIDIELPEPPETIDIEFLGERPEFDVEAPDVTIDFTEEAYTSECLDRLKVEIKRMLDTGTGMPAVVEQMLVDRARTREDREASRAVQQVNEEWSSRGWSIPSGILSRRVEEVRQNNQNQANTFNREVLVQRRQEEIQNFQFAIAQGIALENILLNAHLNVQERAFRFAQAVADLGYRRLEADIAVYNAAIQGYQADAAVYEQQIRAEIQKLERYRLEIQAEATKQELNRNKVAIYTARLEALQRVVDIYRGQLDGARTLASVNEQRVRTYAARIDAYRGEVEAHRSEWEIWATKVRGQLGKVTAYEAETRAFLAEVQAYQTRTQALSQQPQIGIQIEDLKLRELEAKLQTASTQIQAEGTRLSSEANVFGSKAQMYAASGQMAAAESDANTRAFSAAVESRRAESQAALASAQAKIQQVIERARVLSASLDSAGRITSQLGAGAMSAVNLGASISGSVSESYNYSF